MEWDDGNTAATIEQKVFYLQKIVNVIKFNKICLGKYCLA